MMHYLLLIGLAVIENIGVPPDHDVEMTPLIVNRGTDRSRKDAA